jgi:hypothetical protein
MSRVYSSPEADSIDLLPGERVLWQGRPIRHPLLRPPDAFLIPFSLLWSGMVLTGLVATVTRDPGSLGILVILVPFSAIAVYLLVGRFLVRAIASRRARYAVTDQRVVILGGLSGTRVRSAYLDALPPPVVKERPDRSGSVAFGAFPGVGDAFGRGSGRTGWAIEPSPTLVLRDVEEARRVRDLVANAQAASRQAAR